VGLCSFSLSLSFIVPSGIELFARLQEGFPVDAMIGLVSGLFLLFAGIVLITQKEAKFGGSLCLYGALILWAYDIFLMISAQQGLDFIHVISAAVSLTVFMWASGYDKDAENSGIKKVLHLVMFVPGVIALVAAVLFSVSFIKG
jgi:hypothetical protein